MSNAWLWLASYTINAVWQLPLLGAAGWGLSRWAALTDPELQHKVWVAVLILATFAPATPIFQPYLVHPASNGDAHLSQPAMLVPSAIPSVSLAASRMLFPPIAIYLISGLYLAALLFMSLRLCWVVYCTRRLVRNAMPAAIEADYLAIWNRSHERFSIRAASLLRSRDVAGPIVAGVWRPVLLLPSMFMEEYSPKEFQAAVAHECAHIRRLDFGKNFFYEVVGLLTAFHPVTWFIKSQIAQTREMICDRMAADALLDRRTYGQALLRLATKMQPTSSAAFQTIGLFDTNSLERRIMTLLTSQPQVTRIRRYLSGVTAIVLLSICAGVTGKFTQPVAAQTSTPSTQVAAPDLSCTYYGKGIAHPGTCDFDKQDKNKYRCYKDEDPTQSNQQSACEWKVQRALAAKK